VARACRDQDVKNVAVTAGYITDKAREEFFGAMDAANIDLKAFSDRFYWKVCGGHLQPVLDTLVYLKNETEVWFELTTLLIPGENDSEGEIDAMTQWIMEHLGPDVPLHLTAFHPDWKMNDTPATPPKTLTRSRDIAIRNGLHFVYTGNVHDFKGSSTYCPGCGEILIGRDWYELSTWNIRSADDDTTCLACGSFVAGVFEEQPGNWGSRRQPVHFAA
jgi:pyruvate formate lyase activating enzyme